MTFGDELQPGRLLKRSRKEEGNILQPSFSNAPQDVDSPMPPKPDKGSTNGPIEENLLEHYEKMRLSFEPNGISQNSLLVLKRVSSKCKY